MLFLFQTVTFCQICIFFRFNFTLFVNPIRQGQCPAWTYACVDMSLSLVQCVSRWEQISWHFCRKWRKMLSKLCILFVLFAFFFSILLPSSFSLAALYNYYYYYYHSIVMIIIIVILVVIIFFYDYWYHYCYY